MKFLLNNNCTDLLKPLRDLGHDAAAPRRRDLPDPLVQEQANAEGRIIITCDRGWLRRDMRERRTAGLIVLQDSKSPERFEMVKETIKRHERNWRTEPDSSPGGEKGQSRRRTWTNAGNAAERRKSAEATAATGGSGAAG